MADEENVPGPNPIVSDWGWVIKVFHHFPFAAICCFFQSVMVQPYGLIGAVINFNDILIARPVNILGDKQFGNGFSAGGQYSPAVGCICRACIHGVG